MACMYIETPTDTPEKLLKNTFFCKFNVKEQAEMGRGMSRSTMDWWNKQCENVKKKSFLPSENDVSFRHGYEAMREWVKGYNDPKCLVWARGNLDQLVLDSIEEQLELEPIFFYSRWRDVRTAIDIWYNNNTGYVDVDYPGWSAYTKITKHDPVDDCLYDAMMMLYGKEAV